MKNYLKLIRPHHYIKNILVILPLVCSGKLFDTNIIFLGGVICFCFVSSAVYIVNDIKDIKKDSLHPIKRNRPLASGLIPVKNAVILASILFFFSIAMSSINFGIKPSLLLMIYFVLNMAYSFGLKNIPIADISILASGFLLRVFYGSMITDIKISNWLYLTVLMMSFYFALGKRRNELIYLPKPDAQRSVLKFYPVNFLDKFIYMCLGLANTFYALWCMDQGTISRYGSNKLMFTVPVVFLITMKYSLNIESKEEGDPVEVLLHDKILMGLCLAYASIILAVLYL